MKHESFFKHTAKDLKAHANVWANKFVDINLCFQLASQLQQLQNAYSKELPKQEARLKKTSFITMGVTNNYVFTGHMDRYVLHFVISWFIKDIFTFDVFPYFALDLNFVSC